VAVPIGPAACAACWQVLRSKLPWLWIRSPSRQKRSTSVLWRVRGVLNCHDIASRGVIGQQVFIDMHMVVAANDLNPPPSGHGTGKKSTWGLGFRPGALHHSLEPREIARPRSPSWHPWLTDSGSWALSLTLRQADLLESQCQQQQQQQALAMASCRYWC